MVSPLLRLSLAIVVLAVLVGCIFLGVHLGRSYGVSHTASLFIGLGIFIGAYLLFRLIAAKYTSPRN